MTTDATDPDLVFARALAEQVIHRLGPAAPRLRIDDPGYDHGFDEERFEKVLSDEPSEDIVIAVRANDPAASPMSVYFTVVAPHESAVAMTATSIQDHVLEYTRGDLLPPCPGHRHPLQAAVVDGVASWVCPQDPEHHREPIMPDA